MRSAAVCALLVGLAASGCDRSDTRPVAASPTVPAEAEPVESAPDVSWQHDGHRITLASLRGQTVLLHFADAASPSWDALDEAYPDLNAEGATVLGVVTDDAPMSAHRFDMVPADELATAFGITTTPAAVIVDARGHVRGRDHALDADAFFALAAPILLDEDGPSPVSVPEGRQLDAEDLDRLVRAGAVLIDVRSDAVRDVEGLIPLALPCPIEDLTTEYLPADLAATVVFLGPEATTAAELATEWGYVSVLELVDVSPYVRERAEPDELAAPARAPLSNGRTVRG